MTSAFVKLALAAGLALGTIAPAFAADPVTLRMTTMSPGGSRNATIWFSPWAERINAAAKGALAPTDPEAFSVIDGKLYFNYSQDIRKRWLSDAGAHIEAADRNWPRLGAE